MAGAWQWGGGGSVAGLSAGGLLLRVILASVADGSRQLTRIAERRWCRCSV